MELYFMNKLSVCLSLLLALAVGSVVAQTTFTAPDGAKIVYTPPPASPPPVTDPPPASGPPANPPPVAGTFWLYKAGKFVGAGDYNFGSGKVLYGASTVTVTGDEGWQPRMPGDDFDTTGYHWITVSIKPTQQQSWQSGMLMIGDQTIPGSHGAVDITPYGPKTLAIGQWNTYKIPIGQFGNLPGLHVYKIMFLGQNVPNKSTNKVEFDAVGFLP
jgi:hypothetical protein